MIKQGQTIWAIYSQLMNHKVFIIPNQGHLGASGLHIPDRAGADWPQSQSLLNDLLKKIKLRRK